MTGKKVEKKSPFTSTIKNGVLEWDGKDLFENSVDDFDGMNLTEKAFYRILQKTLHGEYLNVKSGKKIYCKKAILEIMEAKKKNGAGKIEDLKIEQADTIPAVIPAPGPIVLATQGEGLVIRDPERFKIALEQEVTIRRLLHDYISYHLVDGIDYGKIHIVKDCQHHRKGGHESCPKYHWTKPCLFKPGSEKIVRLLKLRPTFSVDQDTTAALPTAMREAGCFCYLCKLVDESGNVVSEGRGAAQLTEPRFNGNINNAIKQAQKRAQVDATLRLGLSDVYTQDEDIIRDSVNRDPEPQAKEVKPVPAPEMSEKKAALIKSIISEFAKIENPTPTQQKVIAGLDKMDENNLVEILARMIDEARPLVDDCLKQLSQDETWLEKFILDVTKGKMKLWKALTSKQRVEISGQLVTYCDQVIQKPTPSPAGDVDDYPFQEDEKNNDDDFFKNLQTRK